MTKEEEIHTYQYGWVVDVKYTTEGGGVAHLPPVLLEMKQATPFERWLLENYKHLPEYVAIAKRFRETAALYTEQHGVPYSPVKIVMNERDTEKFVPSRS